MGSVREVPPSPSRRSTVAEKFGASAINAVTALIVSTPAAWWGFETWRLALVGTLFISQVCSRGQCIGCRLIGTVPNRPATPLYIALYTLGFATTVFWVVVPLDLFVVNMTAQMISLKLTGNTLHGWLAGVYTERMTA